MFPCFLKAQKLFYWLLNGFFYLIKNLTTKTNKQQFGAEKFNFSGIENINLQIWMKVFHSSVIKLIKICKQYQI